MRKSRLTIFLLVVYAIGIFITSDKSMRFMSMTVCNFISIVMAAHLVFEFGINRRRAFSGNPILFPLTAAIVWAGLSLFVSHFNPATAISSETSLYAWATGLNSPELRGLSFLARLVLAIASFHFMFREVSNPEIYARVVKVFSWAYVVFCTITVGQIVAYHIFDYSFGNLFMDAPGRIRIGSYVGEPSVMSVLMASGYFLFVPFVELPAQWPKLPTTVRWYGFTTATISLFYAMSASVIAAIILAYVVTGIKRWRRLMLASSLVLLILLVPVATDQFVNNPIVSKIQTELTTVNVRSLSWLIGYEMLVASPVIGVGIGQTPFFNELYMPTDVNIDFDVWQNFDYTAMRHTAMNTYLEWIDETGLIGAGILVWIFYAGYKAQKAFRGELVLAVRNTFGCSLIAILISANSFPGAFYLAHLVFVLAMYFGGLRAYAADQPRQIVPVFSRFDEATI